MSLTDPTLTHQALLACKQKPGELANDYYIRLMKLVGSGDYDNDFAKTHFINGLSDAFLKDAAITGGWSLAQTVAAASRRESYRAGGIASLLGPTESEPMVADVKYKRSQYTPKARGGRQSAQQGGSPRFQNRPCPNCGVAEHRYGTCPAIGKSCLKCGRLGHFKKVCRSATRVNAVRHERSFGADQQERTIPRQMLECTVADGAKAAFMIDSGADVNTVSEQDWLGIVEMYIEDKITLGDLRWGNGQGQVSAYASARPLVVEASFQAWICATNRPDIRVYTRFFVIRGATRSLLSRSTSVALKVLRFEISEIQVKPQDIPAGEIFPTVPGELVHFDIDPSVAPTKNAYYSVPAAYRQSARERLEVMESQGIIEKVVGAPRWISGLSAVPKGKSDFRLVVNMRGPNRAIRRPFHHLPTIDEMKTKLVGAQWFSKADVKSAFHHLELDEESRELTTFQTESGMRRFTRLVFGVNCAPEIFQRMMEEKLQGVDGVLIFLDDILIYGKTRQELKERTEKVMKILEKNNLTLNREKCEFEKRSIQFLGHTVNANGFSIDTDKVNDVRRYKRPANKNDLRSFLGLASYVSDFIPKFADLVQPMRLMLKKETFQWTTAGTEAFEATKKAIADCTTSSGFFDDKLRIILYTDASPHALGAVLAQINEDGSHRIVSFASRVLSRTEASYPHIQKEALGIVWAVERFFYYLLGRKFTVRTDARGLAYIFDRDKTTCKRALNRAEGYALRVNAYDCDFEWIEGKANIADPGSRLCSSPFQHQGRVEVPWEIGSLAINWTEISTSNGVLTIRRIQQETAEDNMSKRVMTALENGVWTADMRTYESIQEDLRVVNGCLIKAGAIVIPLSLREEALRVAHAGHPGRSAMKSVMRSRVWWPGMSAAIDEWVKTCKGCTLAASGEKPVPMLRTILPDAPWEKLAIDFNGPHSACGGKQIVVLVDYYSRYLIAEFVKSTDFQGTSAFLDRIFAVFGLPLIIRSDNGPPFNGEDWKRYMGEKGITAEFSTPGFPQQNGLVERYMQVVNKIITIALATEGDCVKELAAAVNVHNAAIHRVTNVAPEVLLFGRRLRRGLPVLSTAKVDVDENALRQRDFNEKRIAQQRENRKRGARDSKVSAGDEVVVKRLLKAKDQTKFVPTRYMVTSRDRGDFNLQATSGESMRRNITATRKVHGRTRELMQDETETPPLNIGSGDNESEPAVLQSERPARERRQPEYLKDYVSPLEGVEENK